MANAKSLPDMHDWSLTTIELDWIAGLVAIHFRDGIGAKRLLASQLSQLVVPRFLPWGKSQSVNIVQGPTHDGADSLSLRIEMQSGDVISLSARTIELEALSES